jgi:hypothetical protein
MDDTGEEGNYRQQEFIAFADAVTMLLDIDLDNYPEETTWDIRDENDEVIYSGGPYGDGDDPVEETFCLGYGCFDFTIYDSADDGICCGYGIGSYSLVNEFGEVIAEGGAFTSAETTNFCTILNTEDSNLESMIQLYPNPSTAEFRIDAGAYRNSIEGLFVYDINGKVLISRGNADISNPISVEGLASGMYIVEIRTQARAVRKKLIVEDQ